MFIMPPFSLSLPLSFSQAGVDQIVLAVNYRPEVMVSVLKDTEEKYGIRITFSVETEPLDTGWLT
jgi:mannose-1-phosphate guanylyltransferase